MYSNTDDVVILTNDTFSMVTDSEDFWMVKFYAPWGGHCKVMAPQWKKAATELKPHGVHLGVVDGTAEKELAEKYDIRGYPTIKTFSTGHDKIVNDYNGPRTIDDIVKFALGAKEKK